MKTNIAWHSVDTSTEMMLWHPKHRSTIYSLCLSSVTWSFTCKLKRNLTVCLNLSSLCVSVLFVLEPPPSPPPPPAASRYLKYSKLSRYGRACNISSREYITVGTAPKPSLLHCLQRALSPLIVAIVWTPVFYVGSYEHCLVFTLHECTLMLAPLAVESWLGLELTVITFFLAQSSKAQTLLF